MTKRIALFAHYDRDGIIDDYVLYYLRGLKGVAERVLFVSDCELQNAEIEKLNGLAELVSAGEHGEYDFGSWKRAFEHLGDAVSNWDEVIVANDSCYAPIFPFEDVFSKMENVNCDFWGPSANEVRGAFDHISSYFLVFRRPVLADPSFHDFWTNVSSQKTAKDVINIYEIGLSKLLVRRGHKWGTYMPIAPIGNFMLGAYIHKDIILKRSSWLKVKLVRDNPLQCAKVGNALRKINRSYPKRFVDDHMRRLLGTSNPSHHNLSHRVIGNYTLSYSAFKINSKIKASGKKGRRFSWWKLYVYIFGVPVFALVLPFIQTRIGYDKPLVGWGLDWAE